MYITVGAGTWMAPKCLLVICLLLNPYEQSPYGTPLFTFILNLGNNYSIRSLHLDVSMSPSWGNVEY